MNTAPSPLLFIEARTVLAGYRVLDSVTRQDGVRVLEAAPIGGGKFLLIAQGERSALERAESSVKGLSPGAADIIDLELASRVCETIASAYFSLEQTQIDDSLLIVECEALPTLVWLAQELLTVLGIKLIELKSQRSSVGSAFGFFTGTQEACAKALAFAQASSGERGTRINSVVLDNPSPGFRAFFDP